MSGPQEIARSPNRNCSTRQVRAAPLEISSHPDPARHGSATQTACGKIEFLEEQACAELQIILTRRRSCNFSAAGCGAAERRTHGPCRTKFSVLASLGMIFCTACKLRKLPMPSQLTAEFPGRRFSKVSNSFPRRPGEILNSFRSPPIFYGAFRASSTGLWILGS